MRGMSPSTSGTNVFTRRSARSVLPMSGQEAVAAQERPGSSGCRVMVSLE